MIYFRF